MSSKSKILIVDDEVKTCNLLKECFGRLYEVDVAHDGQQALQKVEEFQPDCILLDYKLPIMNGLEVLSLVKTKHTNIEIIMATGAGSIEIATDSISQGAYDYIPKPFDLTTLKRMIRSALKEDRCPS